MKHNDWNEGLRRLISKLGALKYPLAVLLLGLILLLIPKRQTPAETAAPAELPAQSEDSGEELTALESRLEEILSQVEGAGRVRVMLRYATSTRTVYQTDTTQEVRTGQDDRQTRTTLETVMTAGGSQGAPVAVQTYSPTFQGALIVSDGAGSPAVRLNLVNAVSSLTGLGADKITVIKMK